MNRYEIFNWLLTDVAAGSIGAIAIYQILLNGLYSSVWLFGNVFHTWTLLTIVVAYAYSCHKLMFLPVPIRQIYAFSLIIVGTQLYDLLWAFGSIVAGRPGVPVSQTFGFILAFGIMLWLDNQNIFLRFNKRLLIPFSLLIICFGGLISTGFYQAMTLYDAGLGADPNVSSWWMLSKLCSAFIFPLATMKTQHENKSIRWELLERS